MALNYNINIADVGGAIRQGRSDAMALQRQREEASLSPIRKRMAELGVQRQEQAVQQGQRQIEEATKQKYFTDAYRLSQIEDPNLRVQEATRLAESYLATPDPTDDEAANNILQSIQSGTFDQLLGATVKAFEATGGLKTQTGRSGSSVPAAIQEFEYYQNLTPEGRELFDRVQRGDQLSTSEKVQLAYDTRVAEEKARTEAEIARASTPGTAEFQRQEAVKQESQLAEKKRRSQLIELDTTVAAAERLLDQTESDVTGFNQAWMKFIPGTKQYDFQESAQNVISKLVLTEMSNLKAQSAQGATGFGAMSEKELNVLETAIESLSTAKSLEEFKGSLERVIGAYKDDIATLHLERIPPAEDPETRWEQMKMLGMSDRRARVLMLSEGKTPPKKKTTGIKLISVE